MNHSQCAHLWANQSKPKGKAGTVFFEGDTIYSYGHHFPIARHVTNSRGERAVIFTRATYSKTTAKHKSQVWSALRGLGLPVYHVPEIPHYAAPDKAFYRAAFAHTVGLAREQAEKAKNSRGNGSRRVNVMLDLLADAARLSAFFKLGNKAPAESSLIATAEVREIRRRDDAHKARENARRERRIVEVRAGDLQAYEAWKRGEQDYCPWSYRDTPEARAIQGERDIAKVGAWRTGANVILRDREDENGSAYLRIIPTLGGGLVQTSRGAEVPFQAARRLFRFVKLCKEQGRTFHANGQQVAVGDFALRSIDEHGNIKVGCHYISWARIEECAKAGGFFEDEASDEAVTERQVA